MTTKTNQGPQNSENSDIANSQAPSHGTGRDALADIAKLDSEQLFQGAREIRISHRGELYRLRITAQQKLILTK